MNTENRWYLRNNHQPESLVAGTMEVCRNLAAKFNQLRERVIASLTAESDRNVPEQIMRQALGDAEALAWSTPYPLLFLPVLAEEKVRDARHWAEHQRQILSQQGRSPVLAGTC